MTPSQWSDPQSVPLSRLPPLAIRLRTRTELLSLVSFLNSIKKRFTH